MLWIKTGDKWDEKVTTPFMFFQTGERHWLANTISLLREPDGRLLYTMSDGNGQRSFTHPSIAWKAGEWHLLLYVIPSGMHLYIDGKLVGLIPCLPSITGANFL